MKQGLEKVIQPWTVVQSIKVRRYDLRFSVPKNLAKVFQEKPILGFRRRAKYLLWDFDDCTLISHLGMTGTWRERGSEGVRDHDHVDVVLNDGRVFVFRDPRRFGFMDVSFHKHGDYFRFAHLGPEPLSRAFNVNYFLSLCSAKQLGVKKFIMDQKNVVGVGNIYACEALYLSGIHPERAVNSLVREEVSTLVQEIKKTLRRAIKAGGSTISDFRQAGGDSGYFQHQFKVYGRSGELCHRCYEKIKNIEIAGRSSFYCPTCQID